MFTPSLLNMTIRHKCVVVLYFSLALFIIPGCGHAPQKQKFTIGFSQCVGGLWRDMMLEEMKRELSFHQNITLIYKQAEGDTRLQVDQVEELLSRKIDLLIISPNEAEPLTPVVEKAIQKGIPVIVTDRKIASSLYTSYVGCDNYQIGRMAGEYAINLLKGKGTIIELTTLPGSSPAIQRHKGFADAITNAPSVHLLREINGEWLKQNENDTVATILRQYPDADLIFAHNDFLALRIANLYKNKGLKKPRIIGVDGLRGKGEGMQLVSDKTIIATMLYPTGGEEAIRTALKILNKQSFEKETLLQTTVIDSANVRIMQLQADKTATQQEQIERQQIMLQEQKKIYNTQSTFVYILVWSLLLSILLGGFAFYSQWEKRKMNRKLQAQKKQLEIMSAEAYAANEAKVNFFTNISHEFRTPLTLILGPLEELLANVKNQYNTTQSLSLIQKNVFRLLRLVNQLMDFRKIELEKMKLKASENDLVAFAAEIIQSYVKIAQKREIDLRLFTHERQLNIWIDVNMLDKVIFNLLSNAFKFTEDRGFIHVSIFRDKNTNEAVIKVEDNGVGMSKEALKHLFEVFYQGDYENYKGSGLGLALSRELIQMHHGSIGVTSEKWKGTSFEIRLPLGNAHLQKEELTEGATGKAGHYEDDRIYTSELEIQPMTEGKTREKGIEKEYTILIVEDNADLRHFLANQLNGEYEILEAHDGQSAMQQAFNNIPDLIICDLVIPGKDGMALTGLFKTDIRTSHIPVILLTAKTSIEKQIEGMKNKADAYITKPFNVLFLLQTVKSLLTNRARLKEHFTSGMPSELKTQTIGKLDRQFINKFTSFVEANLSNEKLNVDEICKAMGISKGLLYKKIKAILQVNVNDYILTVRLQKAKYFLQHEELSISEISYKVGFSSPAYFTTVFKAKSGITPSEFKNNKLK